MISKASLFLKSVKVTSILEGKCITRKALTSISESLRSHLVVLQVLSKDTPWPHSPYWRLLLWSSTSLWICGGFKNLNIIEMHLVAGADVGAIFIQNIHHPYIFLPPLWHNQFPICGHDNYCIARLFRDKYAKTNTIKLHGKSCLCDHVLVRHEQLNCLITDAFGPSSFFINQLLCINSMLLQRYNRFKHTESTIKYNHLDGPKDSLGKIDKKNCSSTFFIKSPLVQLWREILSLHNIYGVHYSGCTISNRVILVAIRMWLMRKKSNPCTSTLESIWTWIHQNRSLILAQEDNSIFWRSVLPYF